MTVLTQPGTGACQATAGSGTVGASNVTVAVMCSSAAPGSTVFSSPGTFTFTVPPGVTSISAVAIGAGGVGGQGPSAGGGGSLAYENNIAVTPGQQFTVVVGQGGAWYQMSTDIYAGGASSFADMVAGGGGGGDNGGVGGTASGGDVDHSGGSAGSSCCNAGGGGAAGYTEDGQSGGMGSVLQW